jgi:vacuolar-type H+-ATPase subunit I/STV1
MGQGNENGDKKTKVISFRVPEEEYAIIEAYKLKNGLSNADVMRKGVGIGQEEIRARQAEVTALEKRASELKVSIVQMERDPDKAVAEEKKQRIVELNRELETIRLFEMGWSVEVVSFKMGISHQRAFHYLEQWDATQGGRQAFERELLRECLRLHIHKLERQRSECLVFSKGSEETLGDLDETIIRCQRLLQHPSEIDDDSKAFLLAEYSRRIPANKERVRA